MQTLISVIDNVEMSPEQRDRLQSLGAVSFHSGVAGSPEEIIDRIGDARVCISGWTSITDSVLKFTPELRLISVWATGTDAIDLVAAAKRKVAVTNVPGYARDAVAEMTVSLMLGLARSLVAANAHVRSGQYEWSKFRGMQLAGRTLGLVGVGTIGARVASLGSAFGMEVRAHTRHPSTDRASELGVEFMPLPDLIRSSDFLSLHCSLTPETAGMIDAAQIARMQPHAYLINTARSGLVNDRALVDALTSRRIAGAGLDDLNPAGPCFAEYRKLDNVLLSPHIGFHTDKAIRLKTDICISNVEAFLQESPTNLVV